MVEGDLVPLNWASLLTLVFFVSVFASVYSAPARRDVDQIHDQTRQVEQNEADLQEQVIRDPLTSLFNRRYLEGTLEREIAQAIRRAQPVGVIMLNADLAATEAKARQLLELTHGLSLPGAGNDRPYITLSAGVAAFPDHGSSDTELFRACDAALYSAKDEGRDCVAIAVRSNGAGTAVPRFVERIARPESL